MLKIVWDYAVYKPEEKPATAGTSARSVRHAFAPDVAWRTIAGNDPRPLLVLRECQVCNGTDDALLSKSGDNERTLLLATWFHCVKLPVDVLEPDQPFYELFGHDDPEHFFVSLPDGSLKLKLENQTSRTELWDAMGQVLAAAYKTDPAVAVKVMQKSLDRMDVVDQKLLDLRTKRNELLETEGAGSKHLAKVDSDIAEAEKDLASAREEITKASKLELKPREAAPADGAGKAKAGN